MRAPVTGGSRMRLAGCQGNYVDRSVVKATMRNYAIGSELLWAGSKMRPRYGRIRCVPAGSQGNYNKDLCGHVLGIALESYRRKDDGEGSLSDQGLAGPGFTTRGWRRRRGASDSALRIRSCCPCAPRNNGESFCEGTLSVANHLYVLPLRGSRHAALARGDSPSRLPA